MAFPARASQRFAMIVAVAVFAITGAACGGDDGGDGSAGEPRDGGGPTAGQESPVVDDDAGAASETSGARPCPVTTADVVTIVGTDITQDAESCSWRDAVILVELEAFGPGGNGFLEVWKDDFGGRYDNVRDVDRGDGAYVASDDHTGEAYVETDDVSYKVFVGNVECFQPAHYEQAALGLIDVAFGEPATPVATDRAACPEPATETDEITPGG